MQIYYPLLIEPGGTYPYYTRMQIYPGDTYTLLIDPSVM